MNGRQNRVARVISGIPLVAGALWISAFFLIYVDLLRAGAGGPEITEQMGWGSALVVDLLLRRLGYCAWAIPAVLAFWGVCRIAGVRGGNAFRYGLLLLVDSWLAMLVFYALRAGETVVLVGTLGRDAVSLGSEYIGVNGTAMVAGVLAAIVALWATGRRRQANGVETLGYPRESYPDSVAALKSALSHPAGESAVAGGSRPFFAPEEARSPVEEETSRSAAASAEPGKAAKGFGRQPAPATAGERLGPPEGPSQTVIRLRLVLGLFMVVAGLWIAASLVMQLGTVISGSGHAGQGAEALGTVASAFGIVVLRHLGLLGFVLPAVLILWGVNRLAGEATEVAVLRSAWLTTQAWVACIVVSALTGPGSGPYVGKATATLADIAVSHLGIVGTTLAAVALAAAVVILVRTEQAEMARRPRHVVIFHGLGAFLRAAAFGIGFLVGRVSAVRQRAALQSDAALATAGAGAGSGAAAVAGVVTSEPEEGRAPRRPERSESEASAAEKEEQSVDRRRSVDHEAVADDTSQSVSEICDVPQLPEEDERLLTETAASEGRAEPRETRGAAGRAASLGSALNRLSRGVAEAGRLVGAKAGDLREAARRRAAERERAASRAKAHRPRRAAQARPRQAKKAEPRPSALQGLLARVRSGIEARREARSARPARDAAPKRASAQPVPAAAWRRGAVAVMVYLVVVNAAYFFVLKPAQDRLGGLRAQKTTIHDFFVVSESSEAVERFKGNLMRGDQRITVLSELEQYARETGVKIVDEPSLLPTAEISENVGEHPIEMTLRGTYHEIAAFVSRVEGPDRVLAVQDLEIEAAEDGAREHRATLLIAAMSWRE